MEKDYEIIAKFKIGEKFRENITEQVANMVTMEIPQYIEIEHVASHPDWMGEYQYFVKQIYASGRINFETYFENHLVLNYEKFDK